MNGTVTRNQQREEAIKRLRILEGKGLMPRVREDFEQGKVAFSERMEIFASRPSGILFRLEENPKLEQVVRDFEAKTGGLAYHATHEYFAFGEIVDIFYVSKHTEEWPQDRKDLRGGRGVFLGPHFVDAKQKNYQKSSREGTAVVQLRDGRMRRASIPHRTIPRL